MNELAIAIVMVLGWALVFLGAALLWILAARAVKTWKEMRK